jgi:hypothetical protein
MLANDNHLFTTQAHQQATNKNLAILKRDIDKRFNDVNERIEGSHARLEARIGDSHAMLNERIEDSYARLEARIEDSYAMMKESKSGTSNALHKIGEIHVIFRQLDAPTSPLKIALVKVFFPLQPCG